MVLCICMVSLVYWHSSVDDMRLDGVLVNYWLDTACC
jgi:hypothetical protein